MSEENGISRELTVVDAPPVSAKALQQQVNAIQEAMQQVMKKDVHYGTVPGCGDKPTLLKSGAEKLCMMFRLRPTLEIQEKALPNDHREYTIITSLHDVHGTVIGQGVGLCSTMEKKYRWRNSERVCPQCKKPTIIKGKEEYGGGFICFAKKGGCGAKFSDTDQAIIGQQVGQSENSDIADTYNTVLKMAKKRSMVDATLTTTAASDIFTQDIEDMGPPEYGAHTPPTPQPKAAKEYRYTMAATKKFVPPGDEDRIKARLKKDFGATFDKESGELVTKKLVPGWDEALTVNIKAKLAADEAMGDDDLPFNSETGEVEPEYVDEEAEAHFAGLAVNPPDPKVLNREDAKAVVERMKKTKTTSKSKPYVDRPIEFKENI